eukprot:GEMP01035287.1.p1 GENE.GEMP01035287.1~~GEMP01035287.1.p1  ORF type:complete len:199 (+),score=22.80 GEMP01035287.1:25-621(+)
MDRYYPKERGVLPHKQDWYRSTYDVLTNSKLQERSPYPPGYAGHLRGAMDRFGYGSVPMDPSEVPPHRRNISFARPHALKQPKLCNVHLRRAEVPEMKRKPHRSKSEHTILEDGKHLYFRSSGFCDSGLAAQIEKDRPFTSSRPGSTGTGFYLCQPTQSWQSNAKMSVETTARSSFQNFQPPLRGLHYLQMQRNSVTR